jgi:polar amino acid transport system substrate-binding protein
MKRWSTVVLVVTLLAIPGCSLVHRGAQDETPSPVIARIVRHGELRVGTSGNQPPLNATTKDGRIIGFDADLGAALANAMGVNLRMVPMDFHDLIPSLQRGDIDMILSGMTMTPQRNLKVAFVGPYLVSGMSILTKSKTMAALRKADQINTPDVTLVTLRGSTGEKFAEDNVPKAKLILTDTLDEAVAMVIDGKVDALLADQPFCTVTVYRNRDKDLVTLDTPFTFEPLGVGLPPNDPLLINWTQNVLADLDDSGAIFDMMYNWFEQDAWLEQLK